MNSFFNLIFNPQKETKPEDQEEKRKEEQKNFLKQVTADDVDFWHLNGYESWAKVVKVYDGDLVHCVFFLNGKAVKFRVRLKGIDTADKTSKRKDEKLWAYQAMDRLNQLIDGELVYLVCGGWDKYGRLLGKLYYDSGKLVCFNDDLIEKGLAYVYQGGTRKKFEEWAPRRAIGID